MRSYGFKHLKTENFEKFVSAIECDGTIGAMHDHTNDYHVDLLTGTEKFDFRTFIKEDPDSPAFDEVLTETHEELCDARWGLLFAFCQGVDELHMCHSCNHISTVFPCACGKGRGFTKLYSMDWVCWNIFGLDMAKSWLKVCFEKLGRAAFHPDNDPLDIREANGASVFDAEEAKWYDINMDKCFDLFDEAGEDLYDWCMKNLFND